MKDAAPQWPLAGLRVLDLSTQISGPYCTKLLADAGADVIKLESPEGGDPLRRWSASGAEIPDDQDGALFQFLNASKRSVVADLDSSEGRRLVLDLAPSIDLVVESFGPGAMQQHELALETLQAKNPALSLVSISAWGATGPWADRPATEWTLQAAVGCTGYRGLPERGPVGAGGRLGEYVAGIYAALGAMGAWLSSRNTGRGQSVDLSTYEAILSCMTTYFDLSSQFFGGSLDQAVETPSIERAKDGWVGMCTYTGQQWKDFCTIIGHPKVGDDEKFYDGAVRMQHREFLGEIIQAWISQRTVDEVIETLSLMRIPAAPIGDGRNLPGMDHFVERGVFMENPGGFLQPRPHYVLGEGVLRAPESAPRLGEHTEEVKTEAARAKPRIRSGSADGDVLPLAGLRVVDLTQFWAGPASTSFLADMGADVVKVESIQRPDGMRFVGSVPNDALWESSTTFHGANTGKRAVTVQIDSDEGMALLKRLIADADVVTENFSVRVIENFGLGWDVIREINPRAIMMRMPAFGLDGPWRDRTGFAPNVEQVSALAWITGYQDMPLVVRGACDPIGGMHAVFALLMALERRRATGEGQLVEVALVEPALNIAAEQVIEYSAYGQLLSRQGNRGPYAAPQGVYPCAQGEEYLALAVATDQEWKALVSLLGDPAWARDPELAEAAGRRGKHDMIDGHLTDWLADQTAEAAADRLAASGVPANRVVNAYHVMPNPQLEHRQFYQEMEHPHMGRKRYPGLPMRFSALGPHLHRSPPPTLGQHNDEVLGGDLGLSPEELERLREEKIIGERPTFM